MKYPFPRGALGVCCQGGPANCETGGHRLNGGAEQGLQGRGGERRRGGVWDGVDAVRERGTPLRISKPRWDVGLARDPVMLDCRELQPSYPGSQGVGSGRYLGEALLAEIKQDSD